MRIHWVVLLSVLTTASCGSKRDSPPAPKAVDVAAPGSAAHAPAAQVAPADAPPPGTKLVDLSTVPDADGQTHLVRATIELPARATVEVVSSIANGEPIATAKIGIAEIPIAPERAELTAVAIEIVELPEPPSFAKVKASYAPQDLVRAETDAAGNTFVSRVGHDFAVNVHRGAFLCSAVGADGNGILEVAVPVVVRACQSLRPTP